MCVFVCVFIYQLSVKTLELEGSTENIDVVYENWAYLNKAGSFPYIVKQPLNGIKKMWQQWT